MLGISLLLVGILLVSNGVLFLSKAKSTVKLENGEEKIEIVPLVVKSPKSIAFFNIVVAGFLIIGNMIALGIVISRANPDGGNFVAFQNVAAGLIFGVTYVFIAGNLLLKLDGKPFGIFCIFASIIALVIAFDSFIYVARWGLFDFGIHALILGILWMTWFALWFAGVLQFIFKIKKMEKIFPWISITVGIIGAFVPALALLMGWWPLL